mgnify:CR=1 FL=1|jgi:hypothetical protein
MRATYTARRRRYLVGGVLIGALTSALVAQQSTSLSAEEVCVGQDGTCYDEGCYLYSGQGGYFWHCEADRFGSCWCTGS